MPSFWIDFSEGIWAKIVLMAEKKNILRSEVIQRAVDSYFYLNSEVESGKKLILRDAAGNEREVVFIK